MAAERRDRAFRNRRNQTLRTPRGLDLPGQDAVIPKAAQGPAPPGSLRAVLASLQPVDEDFPPIEDRTAEPVGL
jgi:antitoxin VapB